MGYLIAILVIAIFTVILMVWAKKENEILDNLLSNLTEEQKRNLEDNQVEDFDVKKHTWTQRGMIAEVNVKGKNKVALKVLWYISYHDFSLLIFQSFSHFIGNFINTFCPFIPGLTALISSFVS